MGVGGRDISRKFQYGVKSTYYWGGWDASTGNISYISQEDGVHVLEKGIVIEAEMEYQNDQGSNIDAFTKTNEFNKVKGK